MILYDSRRKYRSYPVSRKSEAAWYVLLASKIPQKTSGGGKRGLITGRWGGGLVWWMDGVYEGHKYAVLFSSWPLSSLFLWFIGSACEHGCRYFYLNLIHSTWRGGVLGGISEWTWQTPSIKPLINFRNPNFHQILNNVLISSLIWIWWSNKF